MWEIKICYFNYLAPLAGPCFWRSCGVIYKKKENNYCRPTFFQARPKKCLDVAIFVYFPVQSKPVTLKKLTHTHVRTHTTWLLFTLYGKRVTTKRSGKEGTLQTVMLATWSFLQRAKTRAVATGPHCITSLPTVIWEQVHAGKRHQWWHVTATDMITLKDVQRHPLQWSQWQWGWANTSIFCFYAQLVDDFVLLTIHWGAIASCQG